MTEGNGTQRAVGKLSGELAALVRETVWCRRTCAEWRAALNDLNKAMAVHLQHHQNTDDLVGKSRDHFWKVAALVQPAALALVLFLLQRFIR